MATPKPVLVLGATGKQGKKVVDTLLASESKDAFTILALTRNPESASAKALAAKSPTIKLVKGNLDDVRSIFDAALEATDNTPIWGVFSVQQAVTDGATQDRETKQGKDMIDAAVAHDVKVFVYTSVDRGGDKSDGNPTYVPHFISKHNIEVHLKEKAKDSGMSYTILRPTAFMEGMTPNFMVNKIFPTMLKTQSNRNKPLAFVATSDIGFFAAQSFLQPDSSDYKNKAISLAGDNLTFDQVNEVFKKTLGYSVPTTFGFVSGFIKWMVPEVGTMLRWFDEEGYDVDIAKLKRMNPGMMSLGDWLVKEGGWPVRK